MWVRDECVATDDGCLLLCDDVAMQEDGPTALVVASANGHAEVVAELLASGAAVNQGTTVSMCGVVRRRDVRVFGLFDWCL